MLDLEVIKAQSAKARAGIERQAHTYMPADPAGYADGALDNIDDLIAEVERLQAEYERVYDLLDRLSCACSEDARKELDQPEIPLPDTKEGSQ